jgi:hypothetical protein
VQDYQALDPRRCSDVLPNEITIPFQEQWKLYVISSRHLFQDVNRWNPELLREFYTVVELLRAIWHRVYKASLSPRPSRASSDQNSRILIPAGWLIGHDDERRSAEMVRHGR